MRNGDRIMKQVSSCGSPRPPWLVSLPLTATCLGLLPTPAQHRCVTPHPPPRCQAPKSGKEGKPRKEQGLHLGHRLALVRLLASAGATERPGGLARVKTVIPGSPSLPVSTQPSSFVKVVGPVLSRSPGCLGKRGRAQSPSCTCACPTEQERAHPVSPLPVCTQTNSTPRHPSQPELWGKTQGKTCLGVKISLIQNLIHILNRCVT